MMVRSLISLRVGKDVTYKCGGVPGLCGRLVWRRAIPMWYVGGMQSSTYAEIMDLLVFSGDTKNAYLISSISDEKCYSIYLLQVRCWEWMASGSCKYYCRLDEQWLPSSKYPSFPLIVTWRLRVCFRLSGDGTEDVSKPCCGQLHAWDLCVMWSQKSQ